jgi:hypothetical protein
MTDARTIWLFRHPDGSFTDYGRNGRGKHRGCGPARHYTGEAAKVMELVIRHMSQAAHSVTS